MGYNNGSTSIVIGKKAFISSVIILLILTLIAGVLTQVIPRGHYQRIKIVDGEVIVPGSFSYTDQKPLPFYNIFYAWIEVLFSPGNILVISIVMFILIIGVCFAIIDKTKVLHEVIRILSIKFAHNKVFLMALVSLFFMLIGSMFGIFEEMIPLIPLILLLCKNFGWDQLLGLSMSLLATGFGFASAISNPFTLGVAQRLASIPIFSGVGLRLIVFITIYLILLLFLMMNAKKAESKKIVEDDIHGKGRVNFSEDELFNPETFTNYENSENTSIDKKNEKIVKGKNHENINKNKNKDDENLNKDKNNEDLNKDRRNSASLDKSTKTSVIFFIVMIIIIVLFIVTTLFVKAISSLSLPFIALIIIIIAIGTSAIKKINAKDVFKTAIDGLSGIAPAIILILLAMGVNLIIKKGNIIDTILYYASNRMQKARTYGTALGIYFITLFMNFFIGSASAKAFLLMPILTPLADITGVTRQVAVLAFQFGDGFSNVIYPTNPVLLIGLAISSISYPKWLKYTLGLQLIILLVTSLFICLAVAIGYH